MNRDQLQGQWKQIMGEAKRQWGKLTDDDLQQIDGDHDKLVGTIQEKYGKSREEAEQEVAQWENSQA